MNRFYLPVGSQGVGIRHSKELPTQCQLNGAHYYDTSTVFFQPRGILCRGRLGGYPLYSTCGCAWLTHASWSCSKYIFKTERKNKTDEENSSV